jgi:hypothetical protein
MYNVTLRVYLLSQGWDGRGMKYAWKIWHTLTVFVRKRGGKVPFEEKGTGGRTTLKWILKKYILRILKKYGAAVWVGFIWLEIGSSGEMLMTEVKHRDPYKAGNFTISFSGTLDLLEVKVYYYYWGGGGRHSRLMVRTAKKCWFITEIKR